MTPKALFAGGQRILIDPDGRPAKVKTQKPAFGAFKGVHAIFPAQVDGEPLYIAEGPESALTVHMATGAEVWAVFGVDNWQNMPVPAGRKVVLCPDMDPEGSRAQSAFQKARDHFVASGFDVWIATPPAPYEAKDDFNDTLRRDGIEAVQEALRDAQKAVPPAPIVDTLPPPAKLESKRKGDLVKAMQDASIADAAAVAHAVAIHMQWKAPFEYDAAHVVESIKAHMSDKLQPEVFDLLRAKVDLLLSRRKAAVLNRTAIPGNTRHKVRLISSLSEIDVACLSGVVLIKAPMGAGKTQLVGKPLADLHRAGFMAIAHRVSLIDELAARLKVAHYRSDDIDPANGLAVCLPSIARADLRSISPRVIFIDEVAQVLRFLKSNAACSCGDAMNSQIYEDILDLVRTAETVVAADADLDVRTIQFMELARPNERFAIYQLQPRPNGKTALFYPDSKRVLDLVSTALETDGKVWVACESRQKAESYATHFTDRGHKVMCITSDNKDGKAQKAFLKDADQQSRQYDLVIASPAISSGLSIEHKGSPHFTLGAFMGAGTAIRPEDAMQMMARVRYLDTVLVGIDPSNALGGQSAKKIQDGLMGAAQIEDKAPVWTDFDSYVASIEAEDMNACADFGAGLWWKLDAAGWTLEHGPGGDERTGCQLHKNARQRYEKDREMALLSAAPMTRHEYDTALRAQDSLPDVRDRIEATQIRLAFGRNDLTSEDIRRWEGGRFLETIKRFEDLIGADVARGSDGAHITQRTLRTARCKLFERLFEGCDLSKGFTLSTELAETILDRIMTMPEVFAAVDIVDRKYQRDKLKRPKVAVREVKGILQKCGLDLSQRRTKTYPHAASLVNKRGQSGQSSEVKAEKGQRQKRYYVMTAESYQEMVALLVRRATYTLPQEISAPDRATEEPLLAVQDTVRPSAVTSTPDKSQSAPVNLDNVADAAQLEFARAMRAASAMAEDQNAYVTKMRAKPQSAAARVAHALQLGISLPANIVRQTGLDVSRVMATLERFRELKLAHQARSGDWSLTFSARIIPYSCGAQPHSGIPLDVVTGRTVPKLLHAPVRHIIWMAKEQPLRISHPLRRYSVSPAGDVDLVRDFAAEALADAHAESALQAFIDFDRKNDPYSEEAWE